MPYGAKNIYFDTYVLTVARACSVLFHSIFSFMDGKNFASDRFPRKIHMCSSEAVMISLLVESYSALSMRGENASSQGPNSWVLLSFYFPLFFGALRFFYVL